MDSRFRTVLLSALVYVLSHGTTLADVPQLIHYQGLIEGADSLLTIQFTLHPDEDTPDQIWTETQNVGTQNGRFSVLLGSQTALDLGLFNGNSLYLSIAINGQELRPRQRIVSVAYALRAANADDVAGSDISPRSVTLSESDYSWDTGGKLTTQVVHTDSLVVGTTPVIDSAGSWVGPSSTSGGLTLQSVTQTTISEDVIFFLSANWQILDALETSLVIPADSKLDISFSAQISSSSTFETRLSITEVMPTSRFLGQIGNTSGASSANTDRGASVHNQAYIELPQGTYRLFIEHRSGATAQATLKNSSLIIRRYE